MSTQPLLSDVLNRPIYSAVRHSKMIADGWRVEEKTGKIHLRGGVYHEVTYIRNTGCCEQIISTVSGNVICCLACVLCAFIFCPSDTAEDIFIGPSKQGYGIVKREGLRLDEQNT